MAGAEHTGTPSTPGAGGQGPGAASSGLSRLSPMGTVAAIAAMTALTAAALVAGGSSYGPTALRVFTVVVLASLPGWLYLRFMVFRAGSLWTEFVLNIHRLGLDEHQNLPRPPMGSTFYHLWERGGGEQLASVPNIYQQRFEAFYGQPVGPDSAERPPLTLKSLPAILLATTVFATGWTAVLARDPLFEGALVLPVDALRFGFMGAYVFIVQMLMRRFFQSDLKPSAYFAAVARVATVLVVVLVVDKAVPNDMRGGDRAEVALAFLIGFFPLLGMQILQKALSVPFQRLVHTLKTPYPLSDLDGLNIWYEARLLEEGIEDLQNLVTGNLVDIILHTRVPVERLVDWIDQAALQLLLDPPPDGDDDTRPRTDRCTLRRIGVRTATDLETMFLPVPRLAKRPSRTPVAALDDVAFQAAMRTVLNHPDTPGPSATEAMLRNFTNIPNLLYVRHWRDVLCTEHHVEDQETPAADLIPPVVTNGALNGAVANGASARA